MRLFVDMDGTLNQFQAVTELEELYEKGVFARAVPYEGMIEAVAELVEEEVDVYILSAYLVDSSYALKEKNEWLDKYLLGIKRIFVPCGQEKWEAVEGGITKEDILLDDYSVNLHAWESAGGTGIKVLNGINGRKGTWTGEVINVKESDELCSLVWKIWLRNLNRTKRDGMSF